MNENDASRRFVYEGCLLITESDVTARLRLHAEEWSTLHLEKFSTTAAGRQDPPPLPPSYCSPVLPQSILPLLQRLYHKFCPNCPCRLATDLTFFWTAEYLESVRQAVGGRSFRFSEEEIKVLKIIACPPQEIPAAYRWCAGLRVAEWGQQAETGGKNG